MILQIGLLLPIFLTSVRCYNFASDSVIEVAEGSFSGCKEKCDTRILCVDIFYDIRFKICILYKSENRSLSRQFPRYVKDPALMTAQQNVTGCDGCSRENCARKNGNYTCFLGVCPTPVNVPGAAILGNSNAVGAKKKYECAGLQSRYLIVCQADGVWSKHYFSCEVNKCKLKGYSLSFGNWKAERLNQTHFYAHVTCYTGYELYMPEIPVCDITSGIWIGLEWTCCENFTSSIGLKIFNYPAYRSGSIFEKYKFGEDSNSMGYWKWCMYRNASVFNNWINYTIDTVTLRVLQNNDVVASLQFKGFGTTHMNWFRKDNLLTSTWHDLHITTETQIFSINGILCPLKTQRFLISEYTELNNTSCNDRVWLAFTWSDSPCGNTSNYGSPRILYAKNNTVSRLVVDEVGFAESLDIWINPIP